MRTRLESIAPRRPPGHNGRNGPIPNHLHHSIIFYVAPLMHTCTLTHTQLTNNIITLIFPALTYFYTQYGVCRMYTTTSCVCAASAMLCCRCWCSGCGVCNQFNLHKDPSRALASTATTRSFALCVPITTYHAAHSTQHRTQHPPAPSHRSSHSTQHNGHLAAALRCSALRCSALVHAQRIDTHVRRCCQTRAF